MIFNQIRNDIGQILFNISSNDAKKIYLKVEISKENDHCKFIFYYSNKSGEEKTVIFDDDTVDDELFDQLILLKQYYLDNNLTNGNPIWTGCIATVDIENSKISIDFKYEPFIEE